MRTTAPLLVCALLCSPAIQAQDDERMLRLVMQVMVEDAPANHFAVHVFTDNEQVASMEPGELDACELLLEVNKHYSIRVSRPGMQDKMLTVETHLPADIEHCKAYTCVVELEPVRPSTSTDPFFLDFPNAVIRWSAEKRRFEHSDRYLDAIRSRTQPAGEQLVRN